MTSKGISDEKKKRGSHAVKKTTKKDYRKKIAENESSESAAELESQSLVSQKRKCLKKKKMNI